MNVATKMVLPDGTTQYYDYNYWGQIEEQGYLDSDNQKYGIVTSTYNTIGELLSSTGEDDSGAVYTYNKFGDVTQVVDDSGTRTFTYDTAGRLTNESGANGNKAYTYDLNGNRTGFSLVQENQTIQEQTYTYDRLNRLTQVKDANENELASYSYDANSNLTSEVRGTIRTNYTYTCGGQLIEKYNFNLSPYAVISDYDYTYYLDGNIKSENNRTFTYDNLGRLKQEQDGTDTISYTYDRFGNRTSMNNSGTVTNYTYDLNNRLLRELSGNKTTFYNYDNRGNLYSKRTDETSSATDLLRVDFFGELKNNADSTVEMYFYNGLNRLEEVRKGGITAQYTYNAEGIRTSKTVNGVTTSFYLDGANVIAESVNGTTTNYVRGATGIIHSEIFGSSNSRKYYTSDAHGNITNLINTSGTIVKTYAYDAFGVEENIDSADTNPFRYCGEYYDAEINQIYLRARYYDPSLGRFTQQDPIRDNLNWYVYCSNNPIKYMDSLGLFDYDTQLSYNQTYNQDVEILQNELVWLGYLKMSDDDAWGYFGPATLAAVNKYKEDHGLWNHGEYEGVVGLTTWKSLGLTYRTKEDIDAGVQIVMIGGRKQYKDITIPVANAVAFCKGEFENHKRDYDWFMSTVGDYGKWNIKSDVETWEAAIKTTFPGDAKMYLGGYLVTRDDVGNITYGYLGQAAEFFNVELIIGSAGNHFFNHLLSGWDNEFFDQAYIQIGIAWYNSGEYYLSANQL